MYEHPIKRAGLSFNRILFSNTKVVASCFGLDPNRFRISYKVKYYENGKESNRKYFTDKNMDELFPARGKVTLWFKTKWR